jgi:uncharacterized phage protein gp47/JayE
MSFTRPTLTELVTRVGNDFISRLSLVGPILRRSMVYVLSRVIAGAAHMLHGHLDFLADQIFPDTATDEYMTRHGSLFGITRTPATYATGNVVFTGTNATVIPEGTLLRRPDDGAEYETDADGTIASGTATIAVTASEAGEDGNADVGTTLNLVTPISGVTSAATVASGGLDGGTDEETDDALRVRVQERMADQPHGGKESDYVTWAKEVSGVTRAWVYPLELGVGTVTVRFVRDDDGEGSAIIPSAGEVTTVQEYIDELRPVTAAVTVAPPVAVALDFEIELTPDTAAVRAAVEAELTDLLRREAEPGGTILLTHIQEAISLAEGETDYILTDPVANVEHATGEIAIMGTITWV